MKRDAILNEIKDLGPLNGCVCYSVLLCWQSESGDVRCYCVEADHIGDFSVRRSEGFLLPLQ